jgi:hypothetical protein
VKGLSLIKQLALQLLVGIAACVVGVLSSATATTALHTARPSLSTQDKSQTFQDARIDFRGVRFTHQKSLASEVKAKVVEAEIATGESAAPGDTIYPQHLLFELAGTYPGDPKSFISSEIHVYPVREYKQAFAKDPKLAREVAATIARLQRILNSRSLAFKGELPLLPIPDGFLAFRAHNGFLRFKQGSGIVFLTQGQQDEMPVNNQNLSYEFQGLTSDGRYYVTAQFPVAAPFLAYDRDKANYGGTVKESSCFQCPDHARFMKEYRVYVRGIKNRLEKLPADKFQPGLKTFDELISSIEIDSNTDKLIQQ